MATVYLGRWTGGGGYSKVVAVKALHAHHAAEADMRSMLRDEARLVSRIRHPAVLPMIDVIEDSGNIYMVMDYIHGATLYQLAHGRHSQRIPMGICVRVMSDVLRGLHAAHEARDAQGQSLDLIHRDVSPQNVLVATDGYAHIIDFGVARALGRASSTRPGEIKGKLSYLAPEQILDGSLTRGTDIYGACVVLWQILTGRKLFAQQTLHKLVEAVLSSRIEPPSRFAPDVPAALDHIVLRGLSRDSHHRWSTAEEMADALDALGVAAPRSRVGSWVAATGHVQLEQLAAMVSAVENAPDSEDFDDIIVDDPSERISCDIEIALPSSFQPSRTQLTSLADATVESSRGSPVAAVLVAALVIVAAVAFMIIHAPRAYDGSAQATAPETAPQATTEPSASSSALPSARPSSAPSASLSARPSASAQAVPRAHAPWPKPSASTVDLYED